MNIKFEMENVKQAFLRVDKKAGFSSILGKEYPPNNSEGKDKRKEEFHKDFSKIIWITYRKGFPKLNYFLLQDGESYVSDSGWGCMIRSCQMVLAQALRKSLDSKYVIKSKMDELIISWFLDCEVEPEKAPYSIQTISKTIQEKFGSKPGCWLKPSTVLLSLDAIQQNFGEYADNELNIEVFLEGTIYINQALRKVTGIASYDDLNEKEEEKPIPRAEFNDFELVEDSSTARMLELKRISSWESCNESLLESTSNKQLITMKRLFKERWKSPLLLVVMAKMGLDTPNHDYLPFVKEMLSYPESVGMIGNIQIFS
jgi:Peptidase family C54